MCSSPQLFAAYHVFHRLLVPRHPPCALLRFIFLPISRRSAPVHSVAPAHGSFSVFLGCLVDQQRSSSPIGTRGYPSARSLHSLNAAVGFHPQPHACEQASSVSEIRPIIFFIADRIFVLYAVFKVRSLAVSPSANSHLKRNT